MTGELISLFDQPPRTGRATPGARAAASRRPTGPRHPTRPPTTGYRARSLRRSPRTPRPTLPRSSTQLLVCCGALIGRDAHFQVEATRHHPNEFVVLVGDSAKARKGSSFDHVARLLAQADPAFTARLTTGLSSGEGLIWAVRDPQGPDPGAADKRLLVIEPEFATGAEVHRPRALDTVTDACARLGRTTAAFWLGSSPRRTPSCTADLGIGGVLGGHGPATRVPRMPRGEHRCV